MTNKYLNFLKKNYILIFIFFIFSLLILRNPYSTRTLIPNLEPFPDAMYYTTTPRCFLNNQEWKMCRLNNEMIEGIKPAVPPAYSISLLPAYIVNDHVTSFYFINILLSFISLFLLYKISQNFFKNQYITGLILFFYITNYFTYWYPTLAMAENLLIPLFLGSLLLLQQKNISLKNSILAGVIAASFYATKYAFAPLTVFFPLIYLIKIYRQKIDNNNKNRQVLAAAIPGGIILLNLVGIPQLINVLNQVFNGALDSNSSSTVTSGGSYFSISYFKKHIVEYSYSLIGKSQRFLWDATPLTEQWIALPGLFGLIISFKNKKLNLSKLWLVTAIIMQLLFISTFYVVDIRYVYHFLPILLLGFGFFLDHLKNTLLRNKLNFYSFLITIFLIYSVTNVLRLKSVLAVNLKYAETPWWYLSQLEMNNYFDNLEITDNKPELITLSAPYLTDNYSNNNYTTLPLNEQQDFHGNFEKVWGVGNYSNLIEMYTSKIENGDNLYLTNFGVSAASHFQTSYKNIEDNFNLSLVQSGCYNLCNIYKLELLEPTND